MPRIRLGLVGLSTSSTVTNWAATAHLPYIQSPQGQKHFEIVALCNSSLASAHKSIDHYKLASSVKAYESPAELARDPDVDLVVNVTGIEQHFGVLSPVVQAGKDVFTELPLASNIGQMRELLQMAEIKKVKTVFGMQGQTSPVTHLLRDVIASQKIGKVLSSTWVGSAGFLGEKPLPLSYGVLGDRKVGGNLMTVSFLHSINQVIATLGDIDTFQCILGNQRPTINLVDPQQGGKVVESKQKDTPDQVLLQGRFDSGALLSYHLRGGDPFLGDPGLRWSIYGEKGEIFITNPMSGLDIFHQGVNIKLHEFGQTEEQILELPEDEMSNFPHPVQNVGRIYEAYAKGTNGGYPDWKEGMKRHELIEEMWKRGDGDKPFGSPVSGMT